MPSIAHLGDKITHGGVVVTASGDVFADGTAVARVGDKARCKEHGLVTILSGASTVYANGMPVAVDGSRCSCGAKVISGGTVFVEEG